MDLIAVQMGRVVGIAALRYLTIGVARSLRPHTQKRGQAPARQPSRPTFRRRTTLVLCTIFYVRYTASVYGLTFEEVGGA